MNDLELYIQSNKNQLNEPPLDKGRLWKKIEVQLDAGSVNTISLHRPWFKIAAMLVLFTGIGFLTLQFIQSNSLKQHYTERAEITEIKAHYSHIIRTKLTQIESTQNINALEKEVFIEAIEELEIDADNLQIELKHSVNNTAVIEAIVENYKQQMSLLERLLQRIEKLENRNHEQSIII